MKSQFEIYKHELSKSKYDSIDRKIEKELLIKIGTNPSKNDYKVKDVDAFHRLINANLRFVIYVLKEFQLPRNLDIMDVIQDGNLGLAVGICRFDVNNYPNVKLFSFVVHWIRFFIRSSLTRNKIYENHRSYLIEDEELEDIHDINDSVEPFMFTSQFESDAFSDTVALNDINEFLLKYLDKREAAIIRLYFGLGNDGEPKTLEFIGQQLHIKFVRVRQLRDRALNKLKNIRDSKEFDFYF
jgi:RNA polymerase sigma factor (sigma-70 family)